MTVQARLPPKSEQARPPEASLCCASPRLTHFALVHLRSVQARLEAPYYDYLQAPLQPLADDLESSTYV